MIEGHCGLAVLGLWVVGLNPGKVVPGLKPRRAFGHDCPFGALKPLKPYCQHSEE